MEELMTISRLVELAAKDEKPMYRYGLLIGGFLDSFYSSDRTLEERNNMVLEEPKTFDTIGEVKHAVIAGTVHKICVDYNADIPEWVMKDRYFLKEPYFAENEKGDFRLILLAQSPVPFRMRNIFVTRDSLKRD